MAAKFLESTKASVHQRYWTARQRWPQIARVARASRSSFTYVTATTNDETELALCRLRYVGSAHHWQVAIYGAGHDDYTVDLPSGLPIGTVKMASTSPAAPYLDDPTACTTFDPRPTNDRNH